MQFTLYLLAIPPSHQSFLSPESFFSSIFCCVIIDGQAVVTDYSYVAMCNELHCPIELFLCLILLFNVLLVCLLGKLEIYAPNHRITLTSLCFCSTSWIRHVAKKHKLCLHAFTRYLGDFFNDFHHPGHLTFI